jgi:hypothetical protein
LTPDDKDLNYLQEETIENNDLVIAYCRGEPIIGIFKPDKIPLTNEHDYPTHSYMKDTLGIQQITRTKNTARYSYGQNMWIRAKTSISQQLTYDSTEANPEKKKSLDDLLPEAYQEYKKVFEKAASE